MSSDVDICNLGLSHVGDEAEITSLADGSAQAAACARFYPLARDAMLEAFPWSFAVKRVTATQLATVPDEAADWSYAYSLPSTCIRPLGALSPGVAETLFNNDDERYPFVVESTSTGEKVLYTNVSAAVIRYIDGVKDPTKFSPLFVMALARLMASYLAGPILKGDRGMKVARAHYKVFVEAEFPKACAADANRGKRDAYQQRVPSFIAARGTTADSMTQ